MRMHFVMRLIAGLGCALISISECCPGSARAQQPDSLRLLEITQVGSFELSGIAMRRNYEHFEQQDISHMTDSTYGDTVLTSCGTEWYPPWISPAKLTDSTLEMFTHAPAWQYSDSKLGFRCTIDSGQQVLLSVYCTYHNQHTDAGSTKVDDFSFSIDTVPYVLTKRGLTAALEGALALRRLHGTGIASYLGYVGPGIVDGHITTNYGPVVDSLSNPTFTLTLEGGTAGVGMPGPNQVQNPFPNPCDKILCVPTPDRMSDEIRVYDFLGRNRKVSVLPGNQPGVLEVDVHSLPSGGYLLVTCKNSTLFSVCR